MGFFSSLVHRKSKQKVPLVEILTGTVEYKVGDATYETYFWYHTVLNNPNATPCIILHGGPGLSHDYMLSYADLASKHGIPVIFYDQLGIGKSTHLKDKGIDFWTIDLFLGELENIIDKLGLVAPGKQFDILGQSWGGMLAAEYVTSWRPGKPKPRRLVIASSPASMDLWEASCNMLLKGMPQEIQDVLNKHQDAGTTDSAEYKEAVMAFYAKHLIRLDPIPPEGLASFASVEEDPTVYNTMNGPSEFFITGSLKGWSIIPKIPLIDIPTLLTNGRYDEAQDETMLPFWRGIPNVRWEKFAESSHSPHWDEREKHMLKVSEFLNEPEPKKEEPKKEEPKKEPKEEVKKEEPKVEAKKEEPPKEAAKVEAPNGEPAAAAAEVVGNVAAKASGTTKKL